MLGNVTLPDLLKATPDEKDLLDVLSTSCRVHGVPGAQVSVHGIDGSEKSVTWGCLSVKRDSPVKKDSLFPIGSLTKMVTAALTLMLVDDEEIELDETLSDVIPRLDSIQLSTTRWPTIEEILCHRGGFASNLAEAELTASSVARFASDHLLYRGLVHNPGKIFSYSNVGYVFLGALVEDRFGMPWLECASEMVLRPLAINACSVLATEQLQDHCCADGHVPGYELCVKPQAIQQVLTPVEEAAGGLMMTADGLLSFARSLFSPTIGDRIISAPSTVLMEDVGIGEVSPFGIADGWGLGCALFGTDRLWAGHDGTADGTWAHVRVHPKTGVGIAVTTNSSSGLGVWLDLANELCPSALPYLGPLVTDKDHIKPVLEAGFPRPDTLSGSFENGDSILVVKPLKDNPEALLIGLEDEPPTTALLVGEGTFQLGHSRSRNPYDWGRFTRSTDTGLWDYLQFSGRTARRREVT